MCVRVCACVRTEVFVGRSSRRVCVRTEVFVEGLQEEYSNIYHILTSQISINSDSIKTNMYMCNMCTRRVFK